MIDIHSHVLPGIDDGSKNMSMSLEILQGLEEQGITDLICTPHYIAESCQVSPRSENEKFSKSSKKKPIKKASKSSFISATKFISIKTS